VVGLYNRADAERFLVEFRARLVRFGLKLHPDKTLDFGGSPSGIKSDVASEKSETHLRSRNSVTSYEQRGLERSRRNYRRGNHGESGISATPVNSLKISDGKSGYLAKAKERLHAASHSAVSY